jgi:hypothetical protein
VSQLQTEQLRVPGRVLGVRAEDVDGDGRRDLIVVFAGGRAPAQVRRIAAFFYGHKKEGGYSSEPDQILDPPRGTAFVDLGDVDGDGKRALLYADGRGVSAQRLDGTRHFEAGPRPLVQIAGLLATPDEEDLPFFDVMRDWNHDQKDELLLPLSAEAAGTAVFTRGSDGSWARVGTLRLAPRARYLVRAEAYEPRLRNFSAQITYTFPELTVGDYDGDGKPDLFAVIDDTLEVFKGGVPTVFSPVPVARHLLGVRTEAEVRRGAHVHTTVRDLDGDGIADLAVNKVSGGLGQMRAQTGFYYGKKGGGYAPPAQVLAREGFSGALSFADLDGDGRPDLVLPHVDVGLGEMARALISKKMRVGWEAHRNLGNRTFSVEPQTVKEVDFDVDTSQLADIEGPYPSVDGDFNGDGKADFVSSIGSGELGIWLGGGKTLIADHPHALAHVATSRYYQVVDLDGDKHADLIVFYRGRDALASSIVVIRNTGRGW